MCIVFCRVTDMITRLLFEYHMIRPRVTTVIDFVIDAIFNFIMFYANIFVPQLCHS